MSTFATSCRRITAIAATTGIAAITTTFAAQPAPAIEPDPERPCFIAQPRWNDAFGGPAPTCPTPSWKRDAGEDHSPAAWRKPRPGFDDFRP